ncbi:nitrite reductase large subunit NirB [Rhizobium sp. L1K21]|uniref:nitrite reductase large subunit NirB n=1 Tax=Rhizobium sp. L1K21 TaxID=2954933 RepID=UPI0020935E42|nr:nitrite reductase large subunit NirB [Rhizobium sp. L1K21]MCO6186943.1 nitrite reductase large subunit NirB [Rhizobium sp. L1K21]
MTQKLVIIGNGMAPGRMLEHLFETDPNAYEVTIFNAEPRVNYNRLNLSYVLAGEKTYEDIITHSDDWYAEHGITLHKGAKVSQIERDAKTVTSENGITASYDKLVIATGSSPFIIPVPGHELPGVMVYRDLDDVEKMMEVSKGKGKAVVIGGGLLGLEAAAGLKEQGMDVTVLHLMPTLMERQLDPAAAYLLERAIEQRGIKVMTKANTHAILGVDKVEAVKLDDGTILDADIVVMAVGIRPSTQLAKEIGLDVGRGILVDDVMRTSDPDIYALGECVEHRNMVYGLVAPLYEMGKVLADHLTGGAAEYAGSVTNTKLKVSGINLFSGGDFAEGDDREEIVLRDAVAGVYKRLILKDNRIIGIVLYGETSDGAWFFDMLKKGTDISEMRETLIFGQAYQGGSPLDPTAAVAALPDDADICDCNGVCKSQIVDAIKGKGLTTFDEVKAHTKASNSCGTCAGLVQQVMQLTLGDAFNADAITPMCGCTDLGHNEVRHLIVTKGLKSIPAVMQELEWKTSCGCAKCRPALNYYLVCDFPDEYADDYQSRFINERVHANIQKDGTYSVVPRMWGGVTSSDELRAIADVVDKFKIPTVKVTGGQRIDMLGIKKEDLPYVWADLGKAGFVSGHAYAKGLRTVKTCVGTDWCRFGTQDSTGLGIKLEKFMWGSWTPAKVKLAVSGCPRNCAEATCKDIGVVCVDSGYEIHFAGAAGLEIKGTEVLCRVKTEEEAMEYIVALTQMYREQAHYLERIYKWAKRIGYDEIRKAIVDDAAKRAAYYDRFVFSQKFAQVDPWSERVSGKDKHEFNPMATVGFPQAAE